MIVTVERPAAQEVRYDIDEAGWIVPTEEPSQSRVVDFPWIWLDKLVAVMDAYDTCDLKDVPVQARIDDESVIRAINEPGGHMPGLRAALIDWANYFGWRDEPTPWTRLFDGLYRTYRLTDAIALLERQREHKRQKRSGGYTEARVQEAKRTIVRELDTRKVELRTRIDDDLQLEVKLQPPTYLAELMLKVAEAREVKGGVFRCLRCERLFVRRNPKQVFCGVNCRTRDYHVRQRDTA